LAYISAAGGIGGSIFIQIFLMGSLKRVFSAGDQPFKVIQGHWFWYQRNSVCDFLLVRHVPIQPPGCNIAINVSYCGIIVTLDLSCTVSEILQVFCTPPLIHP